MKNISILPIEVKNRQKSKNQMMILGACAIFFFSLLLALYLGLMVVNHAARGQLDAVNRQRDEVQGQMGKLNDYVQISSTIKSSRDVVARAMGTVPEWDALLARVSGSMPNGVWLSDFSAQYKDNAGQLKLKGWAHSNGLVADWLKTMNGIKSLKDVRNPVLSEVEVDGSKVIQFEIEATLLPGPQYSFSGEEGT